MDIQRFAVSGTEFDADDPRLQAVLASAYESPERPRCLCASGGVEMYVARHRQYVVKRMPGSGMRHHPGCPSYEPDAQQSGLGELVGEAVFEPSPGSFSLRVNFPWTRVTGRAVPRGESQEPIEVVVAPRRMSLRALMHFLFERAGINRWSPAMEGKRNQGVLHKYLMEGADSVTVHGVTLAERLYVPEPFSEAGREDAARRRRQKLAVLHPREGQSPLAIALGEFKACDATPQGCRIWIKHAPDAPLLATVRTWERIERTFRSLLEARHADTGHRVRVVIAALIRARREHTYEIDAASLMLTNEQWIPVGRCARTFPYARAHRAAAPVPQTVAIRRAQCRVISECSAARRGSSAPATARCQRFHVGQRSGSKGKGRAGDGRCLGVAQR